MRRPGPLQELPLERFLPPNPNVPPVSPLKSIRPHKRLLSPSRNLPAKRRIINEEGLFSPEKTCGRASSPAHFTDVLHDASSSAGKLDFGLPKKHFESSKASASMALDVTPPLLKSATSKFAPFPEVKSNSAQSPSFASSRHADDTPGRDDYISPRLRPSSSRQSTIPTVIPGELPPLADLQSVHYPGFRVHQDTHIIVAPVGSDLDVEILASPEKDGQKENIPPRKAAATPTSSNLKTLIFSPDAKKTETDKIAEAQSEPFTPMKSGWERQDDVTPIPRRLYTGLTRVMLSSPRAYGGKEGERRMLVDEVNEVGSDEEEDGETQFYTTDPVRGL